MNVLMVVSHAWLLCGDVLTSRTSCSDAVLIILIDVSCLIRANRSLAHPAMQKWKQF